MAINVSTLAPASLESKNVVTEQAQDQIRYSTITIYNA